MKTAIILPAFNESLTIAAVIESVYRAAPEAQIVVIDNNSTDGTGDLARRTIARLKARGCVMDEHRQGKGAAVRKAFRFVEADYYVMIDADMTYPAEQIDALLAPLRSGLADMTVGDRISGGHYDRENKRPFHGLGNSLVVSLVNALYGARLNDIMSGFRGFSRRFVKNFPVLRRGFELETEMTLHALDKHLSIVELPVVYLDRPPNSYSKLNTFRDGFRVIGTIARIFRDNKPLAFFGLLAAILFGTGLIAGSVVVYEFLQTRYIERVPLAILSTGLMIASLLSFTIGVALDRIASSDRFNFELRLIDYDAACVAKTASDYRVRKTSNRKRPSS